MSFEGYPVHLFQNWYDRYGMIEHFCNLSITIPVAIELSSRASSCMDLFFVAVVCVSKF